MVNYKCEAKLNGLGSRYCFNLIYYPTGSPAYRFASQRFGFHAGELLFKRVALAKAEL